MAKKKTDKSTRRRVASRAFKPVRDAAGKFVARRAPGEEPDANDESWFAEWEEGEAALRALGGMPVLEPLPDDVPPLDEEEPPPLELRKWELRGKDWYRVDGDHDEKCGEPPKADFRGTNGIRVINRWEKRGSRWGQVREEKEVPKPTAYDTAYDMATAKRKKRFGKWWFSDYDFDRETYDYSADKGSRSWRSKLDGGWSSSYSWGSGQSKESQAYRRLLGQLQKSANLISADEIKVRWSSGESRNEPGEGRIFLSPDGLIEAGATSITDETVDAMTGKVYISSVLNRTVSEDALAKCKEGRGKTPHLNNTVALWEAVETAIARKDVEENWGGFMPYLVSDEERTCASREEVQKFIDDSADKPTVEAALAALSWNLIHPMDTVKVPDVYDQAIDAAADAMQDEVLAPERFDLADRMVRRVEEVLGVESAREEPKESEGDEGEKGCDCDDCRAKRAVADDDSSPPKITDSSLFGAKVDNDTDKSLAKQESPDDDGTPGGKVDEDCPESDASKGYSVYDLPRGADVGGYMDIKRRLKREIAAVRSAMSFLFVETGAPSYGHRTGEVDDASLFKLRLDDDRIMEQRDSMSAPTIGVCILIDESGSMHGNRRDEKARDVGIALVEGLREVPGLSLSVYGHTAQTVGPDGKDERGTLLYRYYTPAMRDAEKLVHVHAKVQNLDGYAIQHTANIFALDHRFCERKIMFVVSDGEPWAHGYGGSSAKDHMKRVSDACQEQLGVEVYGIGIDRAYSDESGRRMYGHGNYVVLDDVSSSLGVMVRFLRQTAIAMRRKE